uniref:Uncharacterized protein n=1 Tax=Avena sativa TaxID=4498 RepID=A0ACD5V8A7_AVESA
MLTDPYFLKKKKKGKEMPTREEGEMSSLLCSPAAPLDLDDLLSEILLRLPPQPSSLPRASAVCRRWRNLASDPGFSRRFRRHHRRNPPLLGCFMRYGQQIHFQPTLEPPNRVPPARFSFPMEAINRHFCLLGCRHGLLLISHTFQGTPELLVWDPVSGHQHRLRIPPVFGENTPAQAAVLRATLGDTHHFKVVLVSADERNARVFGCVYSSETRVWGNIISTPASDLSLTVVDPSKPAVLVGDSIYMLLLGKSASIVKFDVHRQSLAVIPLPICSNTDCSRYYSVMRADGGGLGFLFVSFSDCTIQLWKRNTGSNGVVDSWVLARTIQLEKLLPIYSENRSDLLLQGFAEENNVVFLWMFLRLFMVQLDSLQVTKLPDIWFPCCHPFEGVYAAGI